ncbi:MAG: hypothetical protein ABI230_07530 [Aestuariivirga sp.]
MCKRRVGAAKAKPSVNAHHGFYFSSKVGTDNGSVPFPNSLMEELGAEAFS